MAVSKYFNHISHPGQQKLVTDLITQAIQHRGIDIVYVPEEVVESNELFNDTKKTKFVNDKTVEVYVESVTNFNGMGDVWAQFSGMDMSDRATFMVVQKRFKDVFGANAYPKEGDLIYIPYIDTIFEVSKKLEDEDFHQWGKNYVFRMVCSKFEYGHEDINTGVANLDDIVSGSYDKVPTPGQGEQIFETKDPVDNVKQATTKTGAPNPFIGSDPFGDNS
ncbi:neck protein [Vibrio phage VAP7]|uniref:Neck protein n=2 Tax=Vapseptimavirus VAP7 TaxID=2841303 RepID=A0A4Y5TXJ3_9CAUD|nr:neck protein [Vibrio phage VAP7]AWY10141.1 neck and head completion protein [Vibrio phage VP-1]QDB73327.1 neck protein [Vibrio phage VAP7]